MDVNITFHHNTVAPAHYDVYWYGWYDTLTYVCILHGAERLVLTRNPDTSYAGMYIKLTEGDTCEWHAVDASGSLDYFKSVYTAASGTITAVEHNVVTTITEKP